MHSHKQRYAKSIQQIGNFFGTTFGARKLFSIKIHPCGSGYNTATSACYIYHFSLQFLQSSYLAQWARTINRKRFFGTKQPKCRRFLQHYYRDAFIESHRKPTDLLCWSRNGHVARSQLESDLNAIKSPQKSLFIVLIRIFK